MALSLYQSHVAKWRDCTACDLHRTRGRVVLAKGKIPCDVLFVGEAPGHSEDTVGVPFIGPAGRLLDEIIALSGIDGTPSHKLMTSADCDCGGDTGRCNICDGGLGLCLRCNKAEVELSEPCLPYRLAFTNVVACIPKTDEGDKVHEPPDEAIEACSERLKEFVAIARPRLIVQVGKVAQDWTTPGYKHSIQFHETIPMVFISHPAAILRAREDQKGYQKQRAVIALRDAIELL